MQDEPNDSVSVITIPLILIITGIFLFAALIKKETELALWAICILGTVGITKLWSLHGLRGLESRFTFDLDRCFPGDEIILKIGAANRKFLPVMVKTGFHRLPQGIGTGEDPRLTRENTVLWYQQVEFLWKLKAEKRGVYTIGPYTVSAGDILGFFKKERKEKPFRVIVYPKISPVRNFAITGKDLFGKAGAVSPVQDPVYILGTRDYQHWQPARNIHWKASARYNRLMEKIFDPSEQIRIMVAVDAAGFMEACADAEFEKTIEAAASAVIELEKAGVMTGFMTNASLDGDGLSVVKPARNPVQMTVILETMARMEMKYKQEFGAFVQENLSFTYGMSCLFLGYSEKQIIADSVVFRNRNIPFTGLAAAATGAPKESSDTAVYLIKDFLVEEVSAYDGE